MIIPDCQLDIHPAIFISELKISSIFEMVEELKPLKFEEEDLSSWLIPQDIAYKIMRCVPTTIIDDPQERKEEV